MLNRPHPPLLLLIALAGGLVMSAGCGEPEDIRTYTVPKLAKAPKAGADKGVKAPAPPKAPGSAGGQRLLAAIVPREGEVWHFKLMGPQELVKPQRENFVRFVESVTFPAEAGDAAAKPQWQLPAGWTELPGSGMRQATIIIGERAHGVELGVFRFGPESGDVLLNVQRWAGQVGVSGVTEAKLADLTEALVVSGKPATLVDVTGPGGGADAPMAGPVRPQAPQAPLRPEKLVAPAPPGWTQDPEPGQFVTTKYDLTQDGKTATLTVSSAGGEIEANLNRWRAQIGLPPWTQESVKQAFDEQKELGQAEIAGNRAITVDITGPESAGDKRERILGALTMGASGEFWFIKLRGPADLVATQKDAFDAFLKSIRFE